LTLLQLTLALLPGRRKNHHLPRASQGTKAPFPAHLIEVNYWRIFSSYAAQ
jgi:hypothetical protein